MHRIEDTAPAARWEDAFLTGNGEYGLMVHGDPVAERIVVNHHRFVLPNGTRDRRPPELAGVIEQVRELILADRRAEAGRLLADGRQLEWTQSYHPGYALTIDSVATRADPSPPADYRRTTDFATGEVSATWDGDRARRAFVSRADAVAVVALAAGPCLLGATGDLPGRPVAVGYDVAAYRHDGYAVLRVRGSYPPGLGAYGFEGLTLVVGDTEIVGDRIRIGGDALTLTVLDRYDTPGWGTAALHARLTALAGDDYDRLLRRHVALHAPMYQRLDLRLRVDDTDRHHPVGQLLDAQRADDQRLSPVLLERLFHAGRYLLISSSGVLPPRLTGLWLASWDAAWAGDFTTDANLNLQMAGAAIGALPEVTAAYRRLIAGQVDDWRRNARAVYGGRGLLAPGRTDGEHGHLFHFCDEWPWPAWLPGADWLLYPLWEHHLVTGEPLGAAAGWLVEAAEFFADFLTRVDDDGGFVFVPSFSGETGPLDENDQPVYLAVNATMDIAAARHAMGLAGALTGSPEWAELAARLPEYLVDDRGALAEWAWPGYRADDDHRHVSHLYPVWPLHEITPDGTPELARAAHRALAVRGDENLSAHGSLHRALVAARLRDADGVAANLRKIICADMFFRSLMSAHNPGLQTYNADAAHALPGVLIEALVDSRVDPADGSVALHLVPAWPAQLPGGTLRGVTCRGRITVEELTWNAASVRVRLRSALTQRVTVTSPYGVLPVDLPADEPVTLDLHT
ncbi:MULTISPECIES: glycosyl hydrolase family 95 catalytic domain-containing protein [unclassified Solwaraspora]|uniref:glycosyl hydrolase family 95 catalytic domain-containing protein n=1 Tax=unclassified Solwaraspora TaxID=2627926 RepID=UPI00259B7ACB|nr:glycoside hydrolase N-terminal domain-containing protein [Solwaraspora sp. WMMA2056]WJK42827.1 glycoside hydrolase N-terminal domain-containing protein [Solwaraspora sp. WMMA2056]